MPPPLTLYLVQRLGAAQLEFILEQIIQNAVKYKAQFPELKIYSKTGADSLDLYIKDNGIGIPKKDLPRIFDKGFTGENGRKYGASTGMGLYLCRRLCEKLGLSIHAKSDGGTEIAIRFPSGSMHRF
jgi:signal transduction histidine kinase